MDYKKIILDTISFLTTKHPDVLIELIIKQNINALSGDYKKIVHEVVDLMAKEHPDVLIELIQTLAPSVVEMYFIDHPPKQPIHAQMPLDENIWQVPNMPTARCHACGLGKPCLSDECPNK